MARVHAADPPEAQAFDASLIPPLESRPFAPLPLPPVSRFGIQSKPLETVLRWQLVVTVLLAGIFGAWQGVNGAVSAVLGGVIPFLGGLAYALIVSRARIGPAGAALRLMLRAESAKIVLIVLLSWFVLHAFRDLSKGGFFVAFAVSVITFSMAIAVREPDE